MASGWTRIVVLAAAQPGVSRRLYLVFSASLRGDLLPQTPPPLAAKAVSSDYRLVVHTTPTTQTNPTEGILPSSATCQHLFRQGEGNGERKQEKSRSLRGQPSLPDSPGSSRTATREANHLWSLAVCSSRPVCSCGAEPPFSLLPQAPGSSPVPWEDGPTTQNMTWFMECEMSLLSEGTQLAQVTFKGCSEGVGLSCWWAEHSKWHMQSTSQRKTWPALCSGRGRQWAWCDKPLSYPKHTQLLSESGESQQLTVGTHPTTTEQQLNHMLFL